MLSPIVRSLLSILSPGGQRARLSILIFHRVLAVRDELFPEEPDVYRFEQICGLLKSWCNVLPLPEAIDRLQSSSLPPRAACITFDDGYADNYKQALPILKKHGLHATFFIASGFLDGGRMWNDTLIESIRATQHKTVDFGNLGLGRLDTSSPTGKRAALDLLIPALKHKDTASRDAAVADIVEKCNPISLPDDLMMTSSELCALHASGMEIGAHTVNHPILLRCDAAEARREIAEGRAALETLLGTRVGLFAYPNGKFGSDYAHEHVKLVRELNFDAAVSTNAGAARLGDDLMQLCRFTPWDKKPWRFGLRLAHNLTRKPSI